MKTFRRATGPIVSCMGTAEEPKRTKKPALTPGTMRNHLQSDPRACPDSSTLQILEKNLAISLGMLGRTLKTLRRATGPIVSCMGAAKEPKGTKKPALTPGTSTREESCYLTWFAWANPEDPWASYRRLCHVWVQLKSLWVLRSQRYQTQGTYVYPFLGTIQVRNFTLKL